MDPQLLALSKSHYHSNHFVKWLKMLFGVEVAAALADRYHVGTSKHWAGATVFWRVDAQGAVWAGKLMLYNPVTGRRHKKRNNWVHSVLKLEGYYRPRCLFGEHLLSQVNRQPVAIVESEKTAIVCSALMPRFIWLATGSITNLQPDLFKPLRGREIVLFPDLGAFELWQGKAAQMQGLGKIVVSDFLEVNAPSEDRTKGYDLADYLVKPDPIAGFALTAAGYPAFWDMPPKALQAGQRNCPPLPTAPTLWPE